MSSKIIISVASIQLDNIKKTSIEIDLSISPIFKCYILQYIIVIGI